MDEHFKGQEKGEQEANIAAINERHIAGSDIMLELQPLLKDYFIGEFLCDHDEINLSFLNGQTFRLSIREVK
jgi:hypothetical protein